MKIALISDVHANLEALDAVLARISEARVEQIACLGDVVGYYADPNACIDRLRSVGALAVAGNHDWAAVGRLDSSDFGRVARRSTAWTRQALTRGSHQYIADLPLTRTIADSLLIVHAALHPAPNVELHLSTPERVGRSLRVLASGQFGVKLCAFGHTHQPGLYEHRGGALAHRHRIRPSVPIRLERGTHYMVNPGSVGQSRDRDRRASFLVLDLRELTLTFERVSYDRQRAQQKATRAGLVELPLQPPWQARAIRSWSRFRHGLTRIRGTRGASPLSERAETEP